VRRQFVRGGSAWLVSVLAASLWLCGVVVGFTEAIETKDETALIETAAALDFPPAPPSESTIASNLLFFTGTDIWRNGGFAHGGFLWAHQGLGADGFVFKLLLNGGLYRYRSAGKEIVGLQTMAAALPGWRFRGHGLEMTFFGGVELQDHRFTPNEPNRLRGTHVGVRGGVDIWYEPFQDTMITGSASLSTIGPSYWARGAAGIRLFDAVWLGPEFIACGDDVYRQLRFGAHATSLRVGNLEFSVGAGWATDTDGRDGIYGRVGLLFRTGSVSFRSMDSN
jgi:hypothetical protein